MTITTFGGRLRAARKESGLTQKELAAKAGIKQATISELENDKYQGSAFAAQLASTLKVNALWLSTGRGPMRASGEHKTSAEDASIRGTNHGVFKESPTTRSHRIGEPSVESDANVLPRDVPVLSYESASQMTSAVDPKTLGEPLGWETIHKPFSLSTFAIPILDASMHPKFEEGRDFPIVDPARAPSPGKFVLARLRTGGAVFRKYRELGMDERGGMSFDLVPLNDDFATLHSGRDGLEIIGTMVAYTHYEEE